MVLVDTSVWVEHFNRGVPGLEEFLNRTEVLSHPFILGELALGNLKKRKEILDLLTELPRASVASDEEVMSLIEKRSLFSRGIGWVDVHLLSSALLSECPLWTRDRYLQNAARSLGVEM